MISKKWLFASGFALIVATQSALAGMYVSGTGGLSSTDEDYLDNALGFSAQVGYQINPYFAIQGGATHLGSFDIEDSAYSSYRDDDDTVSIYGAEAAFIVHLPVSDVFSLYGKAGLFVWEADHEVTYSSANRDYTSSQITDGTDALVGIGGEYALNPQLSIIGGASYYEVDEVSINHFSGGVKFKF